MNDETGELIWKYDPEVYKVIGEELRGAWGVRGIAYSDGKVFTGTADGRLIAIDAGKGFSFYLKKNHENTLKVVPIEKLKKLAIDLS